MKLYWKKLYKSRPEKMRYLVLCMYGHVYLPYLYRIDPLMHVPGKTKPGFKTHFYLT